MRKHTCTFTGVFLPAVNTLQDTLSSLKILFLSVGVPIPRWHPELPPFKTMKHHHGKRLRIINRPGAVKNKALPGLCFGNQLTFPAATYIKSFGFTMECRILQYRRTYF